MKQLIAAVALALGATSGWAFPLSAFPIPPPAQLVAGTPGYTTAIGWMGACDVDYDQGDGTQTVIKTPCSDSMYLFMTVIDGYSGGPFEIDSSIGGTFGILIPERQRWYVRSPGDGGGWFAEGAVNGGLRFLDSGNGFNSPWPGTDFEYEDPILTFLESRSWGWRLGSEDGAGHTWYGSVPVWLWDEPVKVAEPHSLALVGLGLLSVLFGSRRRARKRLAASH